MSALAAASLPREVRVCVHRGPDLAPTWVTGTVAPPATRDALAVLAGLTGAPLRTAAARWLPPRFASDLAPLSDAALSSVLSGLVAHTSGLTPEERADAQETADDVASEVSWDDAPFRLALALGLSPVAVLDMPWPAFLRACRVLPRVQAEAQLRQITAASVPYMKAEDSRAYVRALERAARGDAGAGAGVTDAERASMDRMNDHVERGFASQRERGDSRYWLYDDALDGPVWSPADGLALIGTGFGPGAASGAPTAEA